MAKAVFSTSYLPSIEYISALVKFPSVEMEQWENYQKQTIRNRCHILSANGMQTLLIPVMHERKIKILIKDLKICYNEPWQRIHWASLQSAYNKSPFFEFYKDDFEKIIFSNKTFLLDLNAELLQLVLKILGAGIKINHTLTFEKKYPENDFRFLSDSKSTSKPKLQTSNLSYPQVFSYKFGFTPNLSIVDLIFNEGKASVDFL
ncbi:MAG TPA: WbqC family protein [Bacteroidia bacterium]|nr:WbqC family protein [Bacteroidia bacterium]